jgi:DNA-binding response OmpR family regulator
VLLLDQEEETRERLARVIASAGHTVFEASDGAAALSLAISERPDRAISDIVMAAMDGYEFIRQLCRNTTAEQTRVVFSERPRLLSAPCRGAGSSRAPYFSGPRR